MGELIELYFLFLRIGAVTFGGGLAMLPLLQKELIEERHWVTEEEMTEYYAVSLCTPGVIALNVSTLVGAKRKGVMGGIAASVGFITAPLLCILILSGGLMKIAASENAAKGMRCVHAFICVIVVDAIIKLWKKSIVDRFSFPLFLIIFVIKIVFSYFHVSMDSAWLVMIAAFAGIVYGRLWRKDR